MNYEELRAQETTFEVIPLKRAVDKNGHFYHAVQRAANRENIFDIELARYRHNLLCRICAMHNVTIIASVVMSNHTHDLFMADSLDDVSTVLRIVNTAVSHYLRKKNPKKYTNGRRVFEDVPYYRAIHDIVALMIAIKYIFDNAKALELKGAIVPFSCFWNMSKGYLSKPYNKALYEKLFGLKDTELYNFLNENDMSEVRRLSLEMFSHWTKQDNDSVFKRDPSLPWLPKY